MFSPGNLDYKNTLQDLLTVTFNLMIIIILKIVAMVYSASLHVHITGICDRKEHGLVLPFLFLTWAVPAFHAHSPVCFSLAVGKQRVRALFRQVTCLAKLNFSCQSPHLTLLSSLTQGWIKLCLQSAGLQSLLLLPLAITAEGPQGHEMSATGRVRCQM